MSDTPTPHIPDALGLGQHVTWLRRLAAALVNDAALAEDLVQETALAALERDPGAGKPPRAWLARVLRNRFKDAARQAIHRQPQPHESALLDRVQDVEGGPVPDLERIESGRALAALVLKLDEPTRSTVILRYWNDLPPRQIARQQGVPLATVKSRLARGLERLRDELDRDNGGQPGAWLGAVLPLISHRAVLTKTAETSLFAALAAGVIAMKTTIVATAILITALAGAFIYLQGPSTPTVTGKSPREAGDRTVAAASPQSMESGTSPSPLQESVEERRSEIATALPKEAAVEAVSMSSVTAQVFDAEGRGIAAAKVVVEGTTDTAETDRTGRVTLTSSKPSGVLVMQDSERWVTIRRGIYRADKNELPVVVAGPKVTVAGRVVDGFGAPIPGAQVDVEMPADLPSRFGVSLASSTRPSWTQVTDDAGRFIFEAIPAVAGATMLASEEFHRGGSIDAPAASRDDLLITLKARAIAEENRLQGRVIRTNGDAAPGARVALGMTTVPVDEAGLFEIDLARSGGGERITAIERGATVGIVDRTGSASGDRLGWPEFVLVRLGPTPLSIAGTIVDEDEKPVVGARVWLGDPAEFGVLGTYPLQREALSAGLSIPSDAVRSVASTERSDAATDDQERHGSATIAGESSALLQWVATDASGAFRLEGLEDRPYVIHVSGEALSFLHMTSPVAAGTQDEVIEVATQEVHASVKGYVVTRQGDPVSGVAITPWIPALDRDIRVRGGTSSVMRFFLGKPSKTDKDGAFELKNVPRQFIQFHVSGEGIVPSYASVDQIDDPTDFELIVVARVEAEVEISDLSLGVDRLVALDARGRPAPLYRIYADGYSTLETIELELGRTGIFAITTDAAILRLYRGVEVVEDVEVAPTPGQAIHIQR